MNLRRQEPAVSSASPSAILSIRFIRRQSRRFSRIEIKRPRRTIENDCFAYCLPPPWPPPLHLPPHWHLPPDSQTQGSIFLIFMPPHFGQTFEQVLPAATGHLWPQSEHTNTLSGFSDIVSTSFAFLVINIYPQLNRVNGIAVNIETKYPAAIFITKAGLESPYCELSEKSKKKRAKTPMSKLRDQTESFL